MSFFSLKSCHWVPLISAADTVHTRGLIWSAIHHYYNYYYYYYYFHYNHFHYNYYSVTLPMNTILLLSSSNASNSPLWF